MRSKKFDVDSLRVASPCPISWDQMAGDDRSRHCSLCELNVHNVAGLTDGEVENLVAASGGRLCVRLFRRADGTVITRDCPVGLRKYRKRVAGIVSAGFGAVLSLMSVSYAQKDKDAKNVDASDVRIVRTVENTDSSTIKGSVLDPNGALVPDTELELFQNGKNVGVTVKSDSDGEFTIGGLREGVYEIWIRPARGFGALRVENVELRSGEKLEMNLELPVDSAIELIGVVASDSFIDISTNEQTTVFTPDRLPRRRPFD